jgi:putative Mn2+ efflux pump MntP
MVGALSLIGTVLGSAAAYFAERFPTHVETIETSAGILLIGGLMLLGSALPAIL